MAEHVNRVIDSSAQSIHAIRLLWAYGMSNEPLHIIYRAISIAKLMYAASAWWGFTSAANHKHTEEVSGMPKELVYVPTTYQL